MKEISRAARDLKVGDVFVLGRCDGPGWTVERIVRSDDDYVVLRARPVHPSGEEGADGCEQFEAEADDTYTVVTP